MQPEMNMILPSLWNRLNRFLMWKKDSGSVKDRIFMPFDTLRLMRSKALEVGQESQSTPFLGQIAGQPHQETCLEHYHE